MWLGRIRANLEDIERSSCIGRTTGRFFAYGFPKNSLGNINDAQTRAFKKLAPIYLNASEDEIQRLVQADELLEVVTDE